MKKNFISIGILALLIVNLVLTGIMMFSVMSTNKKTAALITDIATAINLELVDNSAVDSGSDTPAITMADIATYTIPDMTIPLRSGTAADGTPDTKDHYAIISVALSMNTTHEDYATYGADIVNKADLLKGQINEVVSQHTLEEAKANTQEMCEEILARIQQLYDSDFIFDVTFSSSLFQ